MIRRLLIANRGEIATRIVRSAHDTGIECVAVFSDPDADSPHVREADLAVRLPGTTSADTYLRSDLIVAAAAKSAADAVHPGYGFLSENAGFARACEAEGLTFVGPSASVIEAMGSKLGSKKTMTDAGVPVLPSVEVPANGAGGTEAGASLAERAAAIGYPVLVKASAGGGGRGMRIVENASALDASIESARRESVAAFGDGTLFIEPYAKRPRHIEVQIIGDSHGNVTHLFERECSIQRRHQKIVEESPSPAVDEALRSKLCDAALTAARAVGYTNAGTVEFIMLEDGSFAFLEMNTRLQVEHPVTELVTGLDLVRLQLLVAEGRPLPEEALSPVLRGHAIEARLYAEDPTSDWRPSVGLLHGFEVPSGPAIRVDSGVTTGSEVTPWYDPMLAKVIAYGPTRAEAARTLGSALAGSRIHGITTNRDLLVRILRHPEFLAGEIDTGFLERHDPAVLGAPLATAEAELRHAVAAALAAATERRAGARVLGGLPAGWRNNPSGPQRQSFAAPRGEVSVSYSFDRTGHCSEVEASYAGTEVRGAANVSGPAAAADPIGPGLGTEVRIVRVSSTEVVLRRDLLDTAYAVRIVGDQTYVDGPDGWSVFTSIERFPLPGSQLKPGSLVAPLPGTIVRVMVEPGDTVSAGDVLVAIEAMKMEHEVHAGHGGVVAEIAVSKGDQVESGRLLVVVKDPSEEA